MFFGDLVSKNIGVGQSNRLAPKIYQNTESLKVSIGQNNLNGEFSLNLYSHYVPLHDSRWKESHRSVKGVLEVFFFRRGRLWALLPTSAPVRRSFSSLIALAAATPITTATLMATTALRLTTIRLTRNAPMGVIAWRIRLTSPRGAIGYIPINMVVHIHLFTCFTKFGTRNPKRKELVWAPGRRFSLREVEGDARR